MSTSYLRCVQNWYLTCRLLPISGAILFPFRSLSRNLRSASRAISKVGSPLTSLKPHLRKANTARLLCSGEVTMVSGWINCSVVNVDASFCACSRVLRPVFSNCMDCLGTPRIIISAATRRGADMLSAVSPGTDMMTLAAGFALASLAV